VAPAPSAFCWGNGDGSFLPRVDYPTGIAPVAIAVGDFNGDGNLDLSIAVAGCAVAGFCPQPNGIAVLLGDGDGTFRPQVLYPLSSSPQAVIVADVNGDHKLDIAAATIDSAAVLLGKGDGTFGTAIETSINALGSGAALASGDFNKDGILDLAITGSGATLNILLGSGNGTFLLKATYTGGTGIVVEDFNHDGNLDIALTGAGTSFPSQDSIQLMLGNGDGTFLTPVPYGTGPSPTALLAADFNGDGVLDLATTTNLLEQAGECQVSAVPCPDLGFVSVLLGLGDGTFVAPTTVGSGTSLLVAADFNGDQKTDIATGSTGLVTFLDHGDGTFGGAVLSSVSEVRGETVSGDFRNNGRNDLVGVISNCNGSICSPGSVVVFLGNGDGSFQDGVQYQVGLQPSFLTVGDFNGDGKLDLAVTNSSSNTISVLLGNGDGTFKPQVQYAAALGVYRGITAADLNGDGKLDLVVAANSGFVSVLIGKGDGSFQTHVDYPVAGGTYSLAAADLNGDGIPDLAVGGDPEVSIFLGKGDGTFAAPKQYFAGPFEFRIRVADFNGDGKLDLAIALAFSGESAALLLGNGDGSFQVPVQYVITGGVLGDTGLLVLADFNGDSVPDWAASDISSNTVAVTLSSPFPSVFPTALNFGSQGVGTASVQQSITLSNASNVKFSVNSISKTGNYEETNTCGS
jgi:FG-GAP-like repeat